MRTHMSQVVSDCLYPHPLGTLSAIGYIENLASNATGLIIAQ